MADFLLMRVKHPHQEGNRPLNHSVITSHRKVEFPFKQQLQDDRNTQIPVACSISLCSIGLKLLAVCFGLEIAVSAVLALRQSIEKFIWHKNGCIEGIYYLCFSQ